MLYHPKWEHPRPSVASRWFVAVFWWCFISLLCLVWAFAIYGAWKFL